LTSSHRALGKAVEGGFGFLGQAGSGGAGDNSCDVTALPGRLSLPRRRRRVSDYDSPWKEALDYFLPAFLEFFVPRVHELIDWERGYQSLDKELQQVGC